MTNWTELKRLAEEATIARPGNWYTHDDCCWWTGDADEGDFMAASNPKTILALIAENERLQAALSAPETITAEPAADYEALRKQFMSLRMLANSNAKMVQHWRDQSGRETRETLLANAANVNAERDTNAMLTDALEVAEQERDQLRAEVDALRKIIGATEHGYCSEIGRCLCGGDTVGVRSTCGSWVKFK